MVPTPNDDLPEVRPAPWARGVDLQMFGVDGPLRVARGDLQVVVEAGSRAYAFVAALDLPGLFEARTLEARRDLLQAIVDLNAGSALDPCVVPVVRGVDGPVLLGGDGEVIDHALSLQRLPLGADPVSVAAHLAARHDELPFPCGAPSIASRLEDDLAALDAGEADPAEAAVREAVALHLREALARHAARIEERPAALGLGDVRLDHVRVGAFGVQFLAGGLAPSRAVPGDGLLDVASLSIEWTIGGRRDLAGTFEEAYLARRDGDADLLPMYRGVRAVARARFDRQVARLDDLGPAAREARRLDALRFLALAWTESRAGCVPPMIVMRGFSGVGKSVVASAIAPPLGAAVVRSDVVRKELAGLEPTERVDAKARLRLYGPSMGAKTYAEVLSRAEAQVRAGRAALLDATYLRRSARDEVRNAAARLGAPFLILDVTCPDEIVRERLRAREAANTDASDAGIDVYEAQRQGDEGLCADEAPFVVTVDSLEDAASSLMPMLARIEDLESRGGDS